MCDPKYTKALLYAAGGGGRGACFGTLLIRCRVVLAKHRLGPKRELWCNDRCDACGPADPRRARHVAGQTAGQTAGWKAGWPLVLHPGPPRPTGAVGWRPELLPAGAVTGGAGARAQPRLPAFVARTTSQATRPSSFGGRALRLAARTRARQPWYTLPLGPSEAWQAVYGCQAIRRLALTHNHRGDLTAPCR